ncbi:haloacid dehalogenase [Streptococcus penaeicida]|uniref:Haloacid dehalogenase n=1 Tax=Streptococcus penaeicida TaxID=1765960 RepID=A0A2N8LB90_9STRE|nr:HAD-IA family hydrolase [Streptococcus penaeicida]PND47425.1 haloacid dehalogenase [Streptococcus penaeicida]
MLKAIIFDMDGVIVDTEYLDFQLQSDYIKSISKTPENLTLEDFSALVGRSGRDLWDRIRYLSESDITDQEIVSNLHKIDEQKYNAQTARKLFRKDIVKIINFAKQHDIKLAVASSSPKKEILKVLDACGILQDFNLIVSGEDFVESKPNPAIYLHVLEILDIAPDQALVIEDSPSGIAAGKAAEIPVLAYQENRMLVDQSQADFILENMQAIYEKIVEISGKATV